MVLGAVTPERVERPRPDEGFEHPLVAEAQVDAPTEIEYGAERPLFSSGQNRIDGRLADVADRPEPEANLLVADDGELIARLVHVRRQDLQAKLARFVDVFHDAVGVADAARQERRHELGGMVRLEIRRVVADDRVGDGV